MERKASISLLQSKVIQAKSSRVSRHDMPAVHPAKTTGSSRVKVLDLFSGIGGFSLGLERAGMETVAFCEIEPYCQKVLRKHWPDVPIFDDVKTLTADALQRSGIAVDVIAGGFPCQDLSHAGKRAGLAGERSGLWSEFRRLIGELRPRYVIAENVPGLLGNGMATVLRDLAALRYDASWECIPAAAVGAPHRRDRVWIVGHANQDSQSVSTVNAKASELSGVVSNAREIRCNSGRSKQPLQGAWVGGETLLGDTKQLRCSEMVEPIPARTKRKRTTNQVDYSGSPEWRSWWAFEPELGRVVDGVPNRVDRVAALGNAVVPQIPELIGKAILASEQSR